MGTRAENFRVEEDRKRAAAHPPKEKRVPEHKGHSVGKRHPSNAAEKTASYAWEETAGKHASRKSTRKTEQRQRPDVGLGQAQRARIAAPRSQASRAQARKH